VSERTIDRYQAQRVLRKVPRTGDRHALEKFLVLLRETGKAAPAAPITRSPHEQALEDFRNHLLHSRGLSPVLAGGSLCFVRQFLRGCFDARAVRWDRLSAAQIIQFVRHYLDGRASASAQRMCSTLRQYLSFLYLRGKIATNLASSVPVVRRQPASLPRFLEPCELRRVLQSCDRRTMAGCRDYAILLLLTQLGLRAGEVATLTLDSVDWPSGTFTLRRTKNGTSVCMPLPQQAGRALVSYLRRVRPRTTSRRIFIRLRAPHVGFGSNTVSWVARQALVRAGIHRPGVAAHVFRHTLATRMLRAGASLTQVGQVLRHRSWDSTRIYAQVDLKALRALALPWPGSVS
jgi:site-specific recombinase XerD